MKWFDGSMICKYKSKGNWIFFHSITENAKQWVRASVTASECHRQMGSTYMFFGLFFFALDFSVVFVSVSNKMYEMFAYIMCQFINGREESEINGTHATYSRAHDDIVRHANIWWHLAIVRWLVGPPGTSNQTQMGNNISMTFICESWPANVSAEFCHRNKIKNGEKNERL